MLRQSPGSSTEFQLELVMVHLEQMNKRLDMLEKTCMALIEKRLGEASTLQPPSPHPPEELPQPQVKKDPSSSCALRRGSIA